MNINSEEECRRALEVTWKAVSVINARLRWLKWCAEVDRLTYHVCNPAAIRRAEKFRRLAEDKTLEDLDDFRKLKEFAEGCCDACE